MKPTIAITMGDFNGIGPEVTLKSLRHPIILKICNPLLIGSVDVYEYYAQKLRLKITLKEIDTFPSTNTPNELNVFHLRKFQHPIIRPASISKEAGAYAGEAIEIAAELFKQNLVDGIVTAPVSKEALKKAGYRFTGHTEMLSKIFDIENLLMLLIANKFRIGLATIHLPLFKVVRSLSKELIIKKITLLHTSLRNDLAIRTPRIAILGLNPHAGENGNIGNEEIRIITPAIQSVKRKGIIAHGPFSADGFFGTHAYKKYDAVLAMYHDQGLIPLKMLGFNVGVNFTSGLPIVRTSPDHGTAFEIAGKGIANPSSMIEAIKLAAKIINNRKRKRK